MAKKLTQSKAKEIMEHGEVHGEPLSKKQKGFFGLMAGGGHPTKMKRSKQMAAMKKKMEA